MINESRRRPTEKSKSCYAKRSGTVEIKEYTETEALVEDSLKLQGIAEDEAETIGTIKRNRLRNNPMEEDMFLKRGFQGTGEELHHKDDVLAA